jgi:hypothetical protein
MSAYGFGLFFILLVVAMEVVSFFLVQYTAYVHSVQRGSYSNVPQDSNTGGQRAASERGSASGYKVDSFTVFFGRNLAIVTDWLINSFCINRSTPEEQQQPQNNIQVNQRNPNLNPANRHVPIPARLEEGQARAASVGSNGSDIEGRRPSRDQVVRQI